MPSVGDLSACPRAAALRAALHQKTLAFAASITAKHSEALDIPSGRDAMRRAWQAAAEVRFAGVS